MQNTFQIVDCDDVLTRYADNDCYFQPWEKDCFCGDGHIQKGIVQIYQLETDGSVDYENYFDPMKLPYKLKIPLCLGTLITHYHVLTTKLCFGSLARMDENGFLERWKQTGCTLKQIIIMSLQVLSNPLEMMLDVF